MYDVCYYYTNLNTHSVAYKVHDNRVQLDTGYRYTFVRLCRDNGGLA